MVSGDADTAAAFHRRYYDSRVWTDTRWLGVPALKCPLDQWVYQELLAELRPGLIVETGTADGGSALYLASISNLLGAGHVVTIDIEAVGYAANSRVVSHGASGAATSPTSTRHPAKGVSSR
jgi:cephalosporin hydroxylase